MARWAGRLDIGKMAKSPELAAELEPVADVVFEAMKRDPNEEYVKTLRKKTFISSGRSGRISWQVGPAPIIGERVEAKRGTAARALGEAGL